MVAREYPFNGNLSKCDEGGIGPKFGSDLQVLLYYYNKTLDIMRLIVYYNDSYNNRDY